MVNNFFPKILVFSPTYEGKDYIFEQFYDVISNLDYPNYDFMIIDNTASTNYYNDLINRGYKNIYHVSRGGNSRQGLTSAQNFARKKAINEGYDYILSIESDLLPPRDVITRLLKHNKAVVGSYYLLGTGKVKVPCIFFLVKKGFEYATRLISLEEIPSYTNNGLKQVHGCGMGCTLIRKDIFNRYQFWHDERFDNKHSDVYFFMDLQNNSVPVFVDTDLIVSHYPSKWELVKDK